ncbi:MAG: hypothetical protein ACOH1T_11190 [Microbacteriaceae bacterium]
MNPFSSASRVPARTGDDTVTHSSRLGAIAVVAIAAAGLALVVASALSPQSTDARGAAHTADPAAPSVATAPNTDPSTDPTTASASAAAITPTVARSTLTALLTGFARASVPGSSTDLTALASTAILDDFANQAQEFEVSGWTRTGVATVASVTIRSQNRATGDVVVAACIDSSKVVTLDASGTPLVSATPRALNLYTLAATARDWRVIARTFPDETVC